MASAKQDLRFRRRDYKNFYRISDDFAGRHRIYKGCKGLIVYRAPQCSECVI